MILASYSGTQLYSSLMHCSRFCPSHPLILLLACCLLRKIVVLRLVQERTRLVVAADLARPGRRDVGAVVRLDPQHLVRRVLLVMYVLSASLWLSSSSVCMFSPCLSSVSLRSPLISRRAVLEMPSCVQSMVRNVGIVVTQLFLLRLFKGSCAASWSSMYLISPSLPSVSASSSSRLRRAGCACCYFAQPPFHFTGHFPW